MISKHFPTQMKEMIFIILPKINIFIFLLEIWMLFFSYHVLDLKSLVKSSLFKLLYIFIVICFTTDLQKSEDQQQIFCWDSQYFSNFLTAIYVYQFFPINIVQKIFFIDRTSFRTLCLRFLYGNLSNYSFNFFKFSDYFFSTFLTFLWQQINGRSDNIFRM